MTSRIRRLSTFAGVVSTRDLFVKNHLSNVKWSKGCSFPFEDTPNAHYVSDDLVPSRYASIVDMLRLESGIKKSLVTRTQRIQDFLGPQLVLEFPELLCIVCGYSSMEVNIQTNRNSSDHDILAVHQNMLRHLGERFFKFNTLNSFIFEDITHISYSAEELEHSMNLLGDERSIIIKFMKSNSLYDCVIPYRGVHCAGHIKENVQIKQERLKDITCVGSFYSMLGLLLTKFGSGKMLNDFWQPKIVTSKWGILQIALNEKESPSRF